MQRTVAATIAASSVIGAQLLGARSAPTPKHPRTAIWYARLRKPGFTPPGPVFGAVWTALDGLLGWSGYRLLMAPPSHRRTLALSAWGANLPGIAGFSWVFFGRRRTDEALAVTIAMVGTSTAATVTAALVDRKAALATLPLVGWALFAMVLQEEVWRRN